MIADIFSRRRIWVLIANAVIVGALGLILMPLSWLEGAIKYGTIPFLGVLLFLFVWVLVSQLKRLPQQAYKKRFDAGVVVLILAASAFQFVHEDFGYKILMDEYNLTATSMNIHLEKTAFTPTRGRIVEGEFEVVDGYVDKRPFLYPLLLSIIHDISGYAETNPFILNGILNGLLFLVIYLAGFHLGAKRGGALAVLLLAGWPLVAQNATGAGFELLNFLLLSLVVFLSLSATRRPGLEKETLLVLAAILLANVRYESFIFLVPVILLIGLRWKSNTKLNPGWITVFSPWLLLPLLFQNRWFRSREDLWELSGTVTEPFSFAYMSENLGHGVAYFLNFGPEYPNSILLTVIGSISFFFLCVASIRRFKNWITFRPRDYDVLFLWGLAVMGHLVLIFAYHVGRLDSHFATRLGMPVHLMLILAPVWLLVKEKMKPRYWTLSIVGALLFLITVSAPHSSTGVYTKKNFAEREFRWAYERLSKENGRNFLVIDSRISHWTSMQFQAMHVELAKVNRDLIHQYAENGLYSDVFIIQRIEFDPAEETVSVLEPDRLPDFELRMIEEFVSRPFEGIRLSRLDVDATK